MIDAETDSYRTDAAKRLLKQSKINGYIKNEASDYIIANDFMVFRGEKIKKILKSDDELYLKNVEKTFDKWIKKFEELQSPYFNIYTNKIIVTHNDACNKLLESGMLDIHMENYPSWYIGIEKHYFNPDYLLDLFTLVGGEIISGNILDEERSLLYIKGEYGEGLIAPYLMGIKKK